MASLKDVRLEELDLALPPTLKTLQVIYFAMASGIVLFGGIIWFIYSQGSARSPGPAHIQQLQMFSMLNLAVFVSTYLIAPWLYEAQFNPGSLQQAESKEFRDRMGNLLNLTPTQRCLQIIQTASIINLALREGSALIGLVTCFIAAQNGVLSAQPLYWINGLTAALFLIIALRTFPNAERVRETFRTKIAGH